MAEQLKGYEVPVCRALTIYPTISGVPRVFFILYITIFFLFVLIYKAVYLAFLLVPLFFIVRRICKKDPLMLKIGFKYLLDRKYFYGG